MRSVTIISSHRRNSPNASSHTHRCCGWWGSEENYVSGHLSMYLSMQISQFKVPPINWATNGNLIKEQPPDDQQSCDRKECTCKPPPRAVQSWNLLVNNLIANITINSPWHSAKYEISGSQLTYISVYLSFKSHSQFMRLPLRSDRFNIFALQHNPPPPPHDVHQIYLCLLSHCVPLFDYTVVIPSVPLSHPHVQSVTVHCNITETQQKILQTNERRGWRWAGKGTGMERNEYGCLYWWSVCMSRKEL